jgi:hypothetical protein
MLERVCLSTPAMEKQIWRVLGRVETSLIQPGCGQFLPAVLDWRDPDRNLFLECIQHDS